MTAEPAIFVDVRRVAEAILDGRTVAGRTIACAYVLPEDYVDQAVTGGMAPTVLYTTGGSQGFIDRVDTLTVETYAPGTAATDVAEFIQALLVPGPHDTTAGFVDDVAVDVAPYDAPYPSDRVAQARAVYRITHRPIEPRPGITG